MLEVYAYNAGKGDCIRLHFAETHNIFIDSGVVKFAPKFRNLCDSIIEAGETLDALILTHVDIDHIGGILGNLRRVGYHCPFHEVWMNHWGKASAGDRTLSVQQNDEVYARLFNRGIAIKAMCKGMHREIAGASIEVFGPDQNAPENREHSYTEKQLSHHKDYNLLLSELANRPFPFHDISMNNKQSIIFSFEFENHKILFTGDAWAEDVVKAQGRYDLVKLSHHGSARNISEAYQDNIQASNFLICTDGINHPDKQTIAKLEKWYGEIHIFSPSAWWRKGYFLEEDKQHRIHYYQKEGLTIVW